MPELVYRYIHIPKFGIYVNIYVSICLTKLQNSCGRGPELQLCVRETAVAAL